MTREVLGIIWFALVGVLFAGYAVFDGFDLGIGTLYPFLGKSEEDKAVMRASIGPVWDGNEVWLLTAGGALFAAFPAVYATVFSGFYLALMLVLFALIFRAVSFEFHAHDEAWGTVWDWAFFGGSALPSLLFGVAVGNIVLGVPLAVDGEFAGNFFTLLGIWNGFNPFTLVIGVLGLSMILVQGASWLALKSEGDLYERAVKTRSLLAWVFVALVAVATAGDGCVRARRVRERHDVGRGLDLRGAARCVARVRPPVDGPRQGPLGVVRDLALGSLARRDLGCGDLPRARSEPGSGRPAHDHHDGIFAAHADGHAHHRGSRRAARALLLLPDLQGVRRQGEARRRRLLIDYGFPRERPGRCPGRSAFGQCGAAGYSAWAAATGISRGGSGASGCRMRRR